MNRPGLLQFDDFGCAMPVTNPAYGRPPYHMRAYENLNISYETEYENVAYFLPAPLEFADERPIMNISVRRIPFSTFGAAMEASISYNVLYKGEAWKYFPCYFAGSIDDCENETGIIMGREFYGNAKKQARIDLSYENNILVGRVFRPSSLPLFTISMCPQYNVEAEKEILARQMNLRYIPGIGANARPDICQLIGQVCMSHPVIGSDEVAEVWGGPASVHFDSCSISDPWYTHKVGRIISAAYGKWHNNVSEGYVVHDYNILAAVRL